MTRKELFETFTKLTTEAERVIKERNEEYAVEENALWNFQKQAELLDIPIESILLLYLSENVNRLANLRKNGKCNPAQIKDKSVDLINFAILFYAVVSEKASAKK